MNVKEYQERLNRLICDLKRMLWYEMLDTVDEPSNADEWQLYTAIEETKKNLEVAVSSMEYLRKPIKAEQKLHYDLSDERYKCDYCTYTCGRHIEFCYYDDETECCKWAESRVEYSHNHESCNGYYIVGYRDVPLDGLRVRFR